MISQKKNVGIFKHVSTSLQASHNNTTSYKDFHIRIPLRAMGNATERGNL